MRAEDSSAAFDGLRPGVPKRPWQAADDDVDTSAAGYFQNVLHQTKRLCHPQVTDNAGLLCQVASSTLPIPLDGVSMFRATAPAFDLLDPPQPCDDYPQNNEFKASFAWSQYPLIPAGGSFAPYETLFGSSAGCFADEFNPASQNWALEATDHLLKGPGKDEWLFSEGSSTDCLVWQPEMLRSPPNSVSEIATSHVPKLTETWSWENQSPMEIASDSCLWSIGDSAVSDSHGAYLQYPQPLDLRQHQDDNISMSGILDPMFNQVGGFGNAETSVDLPMDESKSVSHEKIVPQLPFQTNILDESADYCSSQQQQATHNHESTDSTPLIEAEGIGRAGYDICFGMVSNLEAMWILSNVSQI
jgi:hypothetical protein